MLEEKREYDEQNRLKAKWYEDENGLRNGKYEEWYDNGNLKIECMFKDNEIIDYLKKYNENGLLDSSSNFYDGVEKIINYYPNEKPLSISYNIEGIRQGKHLIYYENGNLLKEANYKDGKLDGIVKEYYENGNIHRNKSYINNNPTGHNIEYDLNGNITSLDFFINNQKIKCDLTLSDIQYKNNHIFEVVAFSKEGILVSQYYNFIEEEKNNGTIHSVYKYKNAKDYSSGIGEFWHYSENDLTFGKIKNHKMFEEISFIDYKKQIEEKYWISEDGKKKYLQKIEDIDDVFEKAVKKAYYKDENNNYIGKYRRYYSNEQLMEEGQYKDGKKEGKWNYYSPSGTLIESKTYSNGIKNGEYKKYYHTGELEEVGNYKNGKEEGQWLDYYKNGNLSFSYNFKDGKLDGIYKNLDENGNYIYIKEFKDGKSIGKSQYFEENKLKLEVEDLSNSENQVFFTNIEKHKLYYTNGQLMEEGIYKNFEKEGLWKKYDSEGKLIKEEYYKNGELQKEIKEPIKEEGRAIRGRATRGRGGNER